MRIAYFGTWERGYPRNEQVISALRLAGEGYQMRVRADSLAVLAFDPDKSGRTFAVELYIVR